MKNSSAESKQQKEATPNQPEIFFGLSVKKSFDFRNQLLQIISDKKKKWISEFETPQFQDWLLSQVMLKISEENIKIEKGLPDFLVRITITLLKKIRDRQISTNVKKDLQPPKVSSRPPDFSGKNDLKNENEEFPNEDPPEPLIKDPPFLDSSDFDAFRDIKKITQPVFDELMLTKQGRQALLAGKFITQAQFDKAQTDQVKFVMPKFNKNPGVKSPAERQAEIDDWDKRGQAMVKIADNLLGDK